MLHWAARSSGASAILQGSISCGRKCVENYDFRPGIASLIVWSSCCPQTPLDLGLISALPPRCCLGLALVGGVTTLPSVISSVSLRAGGWAELPLIPMCQKALVEINTVVLVEVPGSRNEMQAAVSMEMPRLQQWAGQDRSLQGFSSVGRAVGGRDSSKVCSGVPDSWDFPIFHPCVTFPAALELVRSPVNNTSLFVLHSAWCVFSSG